MSRYFTRLAEAEELPPGGRRRSTPAICTINFRRHDGHHTPPALRVSSALHLESAVIEELGRVSEELGWPIVMTPFAQIVITQAVMNVTGKERYNIIPDEMIRYALGKFGRPNVPIAPEVMDRIESLPRTRELREEPGMPRLRELRQRIGLQLSDEEFLLRATMPAGQVDAMKAAGPAEQLYDPQMAPAMNLIRQLTARRDIAHITVQKQDFKLDMRGHAAAREA